MPSLPSFVLEDEGGKVRFAGDSGFHAEVKRRVFDYFQRTGLSSRDNPRMYVKTAVLLLWFGASYAFLVFAAATWWQAALLAFSLAFAMAGIGFGIQHDANHGAYSNRGNINRLMGMTLDMLGASSYVWHWKHNVFHHTYPNLSGADDDIDFLPFARLSPAQPRYLFHRLQQFYMWALYGFLLPKWHFIDDFKNLVRGRIARHRFPGLRGGSLLKTFGGKAFFLTWAFVVPLLFHPWWVVLLFYATTSLLVGCTLAVVFQLAHCVEEAEFPEPPGTGRMPDAWAVHQVQTTVDFARSNRLLTWYLGGLNFQIEHHLFPRICHVHYPRIADIVQPACAEFGVRYTAHESFLGALSSHWRWLRHMGRPSRTEPAARQTGRGGGEGEVIRAREGSPATSVEPTADGASAPESVEMLDGGEQAYPRMLLAIARAQRSVHLEVYSFASLGVGARFVEALAHAARRGVTVQVLIDGWGSARGGRAVAAALREAGCAVRIYNRLLALLVGRFGRNHRKVLLVDDEVAFLGGINIGDENLAEGSRPGWADLALEIRGPQCAHLGRMIRREPRRPVESSLRIHLCRLGGGWRLRRRYLKAFASARRSIHVAHGYFLPDRSVVRAITAAARRGVKVRLLLAGQSDVPFARAATRSLYRRLLAAGVHIHEWGGSVLHAKVATVDGRRLLVGSFNLDPFSLANLEALVEVVDNRVVEQGEAWIQDHFARSGSMTSVEASSRLHRWLLDPLGRLVARLADAMSRVIASRRRRRTSPDHSLSSRTRHHGPTGAERNRA
jgi:phosphatidylserine/phosphatidylglycerophosphate/cardiolipin synthase-like enzyme/fatty acid desaturase